MKVVVVEEQRERARVGRLPAALQRHVVEDVDGNRVVGDAIRLAVPVVQDVEAFLPRSMIEAIEKRFEGVRAQVLAQPRQRARERLRSREVLDEVLARGSAERALDERARVGEIRHG